jgi:hypothetical protein
MGTPRRDIGKDHWVWLASPQLGWTGSECSVGCFIEVITYLRLYLRIFLPKSRKLTRVNPFFLDSKLDSTIIFQHFIQIKYAHPTQNPYSIRK